uniref:Ig-like domain-containing protein n=1 Tax=Peromyscus maniculatus bairdii TaxID=230844 RepID=A0A8C8UHH9_PERMB
MELTSAPLHKGQVSWRGLLLTALLLTFWNFATTAELTVEAVPTHAGEGDNVLFLALNMPQSQKFFNWFRGDRLNMSNSIVRLITHRSKIERGPLYSNRETIHTDGSLLFENVTKKDAGVYLLVVTTEDFDEKRGEGLSAVPLHHLSTDPVTPPSIQVTNTTVKDLMSISLTCLSNDVGISIHWLFNSQRLRITNKMMLSANNSTLQIDPARSEDSGDYQCEVTKGFVNKRSDRITLNIIAMIPKAKITTNNSNSMEIEDSVVLMCEINDQSFSEEDRLKLSEDNRTLTLLSVVRTDIGPYECDLELNEYGPDVPIISHSNIHFHSKTNLSLSCYTDANPPAQYSWFVNGELQSSSQGLFIPNINTNNNRSYSCFVYNFFPRVNWTTVKNITVLSKWISEISASDTNA